MKLSRLIIILIFFSQIFVSCINQKEQVTAYDFPALLARDTITVLTINSSTSYFIYRDQPMGYHYDMVKDFTEAHGLTLQIKLAHNTTELKNRLLHGEGDLIAYDFPVLSEFKDSLLYSGLSHVTFQVLVQRSEPGDTLLTDVTQLIGKVVHVLPNSKYLSRLVNLNEELGGGINIKIVEGDSIATEDLIREVSTGEIAYTIADEHVARLNRTYFRNIDIGVQLSFSQRSSWAVRSDMPILADSLNSWFARINTQPAFARITKRYFEESKGYKSEGSSAGIIKYGPGQLSPYDVLFKKYAKETGLDWRLLASIAYHESSFDPDGQAWTGAGGLMGLMPATARTLGVEGSAIFNPEQNINAGAKYLKVLLESFSSVPDLSERTKMALAAYNGGIGHVFDARALAEKYKADPNLWDGQVERYLQLKSLEQYYEDPICKAGYFRGDETVNYVREVISQWKRYKSI